MINCLNIDYMKWKLSSTTVYKMKINLFLDVCMIFRNSTKDWENWALI